MKTSGSGLHIRRNVSDVNKSNINKRPLKTVEEDFKYYNELDLDKRYFVMANSTTGWNYKDNQSRL